MLTLEFDKQTAEVCGSIAASSIEAVDMFSQSQYSNEADRFSCTTFLIGAVLTLICIIVKSDNIEPPPETIIRSFNKGLSLLNSISTKFHLARYFLDRVARLIATAQQSIQGHQKIDQFMLDPEAFDSTRLVPQMMSFFDGSYWNPDLTENYSDQQSILPDSNRICTNEDTNMSWDMFWKNL